MTERQVLNLGGEAVLLDLINLAKIRKAVLCGLLLLAIVLCQDIILARVRIFGVRPFITPLAAVAVGFFNGGVWGAVYGLIAGILADHSLNGPKVMLTVLFPIIGFFSGALPMYFMSRRFASFMFLSLGALFLTAVCQMFRYLVFTGTEILPLLLTAGLQIILSLPFVAAVYHSFKAASGLDLSK